MRALTPAEIKICEAFRAALRSALARDLEEDRPGAGRGPAGAGSSAVAADL